MRKLIFLIIAISVSTQLRAQQAFTKEQKEVQQTIINLFEALSNRDSVSLKKNCAADIVLIEYGNNWNVDTLILKAITLNTASDFKRINVIDFIRTEVKGNTAWANYHLHSEITRNGRQSAVQWVETVVAVKEDKKWKIKVLHSTLLQRN
jgi:ketosteroid isomerase-like protein